MALSGFRGVSLHQILSCRWRLGCGWEGMLLVWFGGISTDVKATMFCPTFFKLVSVL